VAAIPESTKTSLHQRLLVRARERWPELASVGLRFRGRFAYVDGELASGEGLPLCRLCYGGSASLWGFAVYLASKDGYQESVLPSGHAKVQASRRSGCGRHPGQSQMLLALNLA
jgi:hypothetical protein